MKRDVEIVLPSPTSSGRTKSADWQMLPSTSLIRPKKSQVWQRLQIPCSASGGAFRVPARDILLLDQPGTISGLFSLTGYVKKGPPSYGFSHT